MIIKSITVAEKASDLIRGKPVLPPDLNA